MDSTSRSEYRRSFRRSPYARERGADVENLYDVCVVPLITASEHGHREIERNPGREGLPTVET